MITRETDYSMRMVLALAGHHQRGVATVSSADIAREMDIPYRFLRKLVKRLVAGKLIGSRRGKRGGVSLARDPALITLFDIVKATGPRGVEMSPCISEPQACARAGLCQLLREFKVVQSGVERHLKSVRIIDLCSRDEGKKTVKCS